MTNFQKKRGYKNILQSWPILMILAILLLLFTWGVVRFSIKMIETSKNRKIAETKILELEKAREKLSLDIESLKTDKGLEENIRERFGLAKEGEGLIVVVDDKTMPEEDNQPKRNWFMSIFDNWFR